MKIAHMAIATPGKCGLYETTRELVMGERALGVDARIVDPKPMPEFYPGNEDRGTPLADMEWAVGADIIVSHSGHDGTPVSDTAQPIIHVAHGRPLSTFLGERDGGAPAYSYQVVRSQTDRYRACVTFWPEHEPYLRILWKQKPIHVVPPPVDLAYWSPGDTNYDFAGKAGEFNVVLADPWVRKDVSPFVAVNAFALFRHIVPGARLHIYAVDKPRGLDAMRRVLGDSVGVVQGWAADLRSVYRAADMLISPHRIYTRSIREAMACGLPTVSGKDVQNVEDIEDFALRMATSHDHARPSNVRRYAEIEFDPKRTAEEFLKIVEVPVGN